MVLTELRVEETASAIRVCCFAHPFWHSGDLRRSENGKGSDRDSLHEHFRPEENLIGFSEYDISRASWPDLPRFSRAAPQPMRVVEQPALFAEPYIVHSFVPLPVFRDFLTALN
jgi:hypothetical protein